MTKKTKLRSLHLEPESPMAISKAIGHKFSHIILYRTSSGYYSFVLFWWNEETNAGEPVAQAVNPFKTKAQCITAIKKVSDSYPLFTRVGPVCFDKNHQRVDVQIKSVVNF